MPRIPPRAPSGRSKTSTKDRLTGTNTGPERFDGKLDMEDNV